MGRGSSLFRDCSEGPLLEVLLYGNFYRYSGPLLHHIQLNICHDVAFALTYVPALQCRRDPSSTSQGQLYVQNVILYDP